MELTVSSEWQVLNHSSKTLAKKKTHWEDTFATYISNKSGGEMDQKSEISRCKLLYIEWINNKVLLYSTGNYIQYPVINNNGKEYEN